MLQSYMGRVPFQRLIRPSSDFSLIHPLSRSERG